MTAALDTTVIVGCGVLAKEIQRLAEKNGWRLEADLLPASLHQDMGLLGSSLCACLARHRGRPTIVFYGACHPLMQEVLAEAGTFRTVGRNCVEMLLGRAAFERELADGALFLLEDWARHWEAVTTSSCGPDRAILREALGSDRRFLLGLRTPCSGDFSMSAKRVSLKTGLPLRWMDVGLGRLESVLRSAIKRRQAENA